MLDKQPAEMFIFGQLKWTSTLPYQIVYINTNAGYRAVCVCLGVIAPKVVIGLAILNSRNSI